jgi:hypothetical protein
MTNNSRIEETQENRPWVYLLFIGSFIIILGTALINVFPTLGRLGSGDELAYINNGRLLTEGKLPPVAWGPSVSAFYAILYIPFRHTISWLLEVTWIGHFILFTSLFAVLLLILSRFRRFDNGFSTAVSLVIGAIALTTLVRNSSDSLYAICNGLMFWLFLNWSGSGKTRYLVFASMICAIGSFVRSDGWILFCLTTAYLVYLSLCQKSSIPRWRNLIRVLFPYLAPTFIIFLLVFLLYTGAGVSFFAGIGERSYGAFEHAQGVVYGEGQYLDDSTDLQQTTEIYGFPEENNHSILQALQRNPAAFIDRTFQMLKQLPAKILNAYGTTGAILFCVFAVFGFRQLIIERQFQIIGWIVIWLVGLLVYFFTFFREGYLTLPIGAIIFLAALGLQSFILEKRPIYHWKEIAAAVILLSLVLFGIFTAKPGWIKIGLFTGSIILGIWLLRKFHFSSVWKNLFVMTAIGGLILPINLPNPLLPDLGKTQQEQTAQWMVAHYPSNSLVIEYRPQIAALAKMEQLEFPDLGPAGNYSRWLDENEIGLVIQYPLLVEVPYVDLLVESAHCLHLDFQPSNSSIMIWRVEHPCEKELGKP